MKQQDEKFIKAREKVKQVLKLDKLNLGSYNKRKLGGYNTGSGVNPPLTPIECKEFDTALKSVQGDIQKVRDQLKQTEK